MKKNKILISVLLIILFVFLAPLSWIGVSDTSLRFLFDSDINLRLAANQPHLPESIEELSQRRPHIIRAQVTQVVEHVWVLPGDTLAPNQLLDLYLVDILEVYQSEDSSWGTLSVGEQIRVEQMTSLQGRNLAGRLTPRASQARLSFQVGDELILFLEEFSGRGQPTYLIRANTVYYYRLENGSFVSANPHNNLLLTPEDLLILQENKNEGTIYEH